ncbi:1093_t:CDS:2 [Acaulospora morrowiae]|uniref:1093_t:CDS:1 n=1 Tax=Acaulospora morrowiae TaxID=94023 RepID=A0A9N9H594_9GLOM|nr:1093_t:CDS:2 [Acaulospora morrowiae]
MLGHNGVFLHSSVYVRASIDHGSACPVKSLINSRLKKLWRNPSEKFIHTSAGQSCPTIELNLIIIILAGIQSEMENLAYCLTYYF